MLQFLVNSCTSNSQQRVDYEHEKKKKNSEKFEPARGFFDQRSVTESRRDLHNLVERWKRTRANRVRHREFFRAVRSVGNWIQSRKVGG